MQFAGLMAKVLPWRRLHPRALGSLACSILDTITHAAGRLEYVHKVHTEAARATTQQKQALLTSFHNDDRVDHDTLVDGAQVGIRRGGTCRR